MDQERAEPSDAEVDPTPRLIMAGAGKLRLAGGAGQDASYGGHIILGGRTIELRAKVASDDRGRFFDITATLDPAAYTQEELDKILSGSAGGAGFGAPQASARSGPLIDDPIPFGPAS